MKKIILLFAWLIIICFSSCKKDTKKATPTYLLTTLRTHYVHDYVDKFTYDDKNRIIAIESQSENRKMKYFYDNTDRLIKSEEYLWGGDLLSTYHYDYTSNNKLIATGSDSANDPFFDRYTMDFNGTLIRKGVYQLGTVEFNYDLDDNMILLKSTNPNTGAMSENHYTYDSKNNPFKAVMGFNPHFIFGAYSYWYGRSNNVVDVSGTQQHTAYEYNSDGYPVKSITKKPGSEDWERTYEYIVK